MASGEVSVRHAHSAIPSTKRVTTTPCRFANAKDNRRSGATLSSIRHSLTGSLLWRSLLALRRRVSRGRRRSRRRLRRGGALRLPTLRLRLLLLLFFQALTTIDLLLDARIGFGRILPRRCRRH